MAAVSVELTPADEEIRSAIWAGLRVYNEAHAGPPKTRPFAVFARDESGRAVGGLHGDLRWGWLHVDNFWLPEALRGRGLGSALLRAAEALALDHGCVGSYLDTFEFQALPFYQRHGYTGFGVLDGFLPGSSATCCRSLCSGRMANRPANGPLKLTKPRSAPRPDQRSRSRLM